MAEMLRVKILWTGLPGGTGYTNLFFREFSAGAQTQAIAQSAVDRTNIFLATLSGRLPPSVTLAIDGVVDRIEETNGELQGFFNVTAPASRVGTGTGNYSAASGAVINWYTNGVRTGRRIRGRTFLVPFAGDALGPNGTLDDTKLASLRSAVTTLIDAAGTGDLGVWARPSVKGATDGVWTAVSSFSIPDKVAVLRSRRD